MHMTASMQSQIYHSSFHTFSSKDFYCLGSYGFTCAKNQHDNDSHLTLIQSENVTGTLSTRFDLIGHEQYNVYVYRGLTPLNFML